MHIINLTPLEPGVYNDHNADHITVLPEGWAYIPEDFPLPSSFPRLGSIEAEEMTYTREVERQKEVMKTHEVPSVDENGDAVVVTEEYTELETVMEPVEYTMMTVTAMTEGTLPELDLLREKTARVAESKTALAEYLAAHPLMWSDGQQYSVTAEKQSLLTAQIALYQMAASAGQPYELHWNPTGGECTVWTIEELSALALAIGAYVQPLVSYQQAKEVEIMACETLEAVNAVEVDYDAVHSGEEVGNMKDDAADTDDVEVNDDEALD